MYEINNRQTKKNRHAGNPSIPDVAVSSNVKRRSVRRARTSDACARDRPHRQGCRPPDYEGWRGRTACTRLFLAHRSVRVRKRRCDVRTQTSAPASRATCLALTYAGRVLTIR